MKVYREFNEYDFSEVFDEMQDGATTAIKTIDYPHHEIHEGTSFTAYYTVTTASTDAHRSGLYIKTPDDVRCHAIISFSASHAATLSICEAPTIAANIGTHTGVIRNRDRNSATVSKCMNNATVILPGYFTTLTEAQIAGDGTWATGTVIRTEPLKAGDGPHAAGGASRDTEEYILKANTAYVFLITNVGANANTHYIFADWYEH